MSDQVEQLQPSVTEVKREELSSPFRLPTRDLDDVALPPMQPMVSNAQHRGQTRLKLPVMEPKHDPFPARSQDTPFVLPRSYKPPGPLPLSIPFSVLGESKQQPKVLPKIRYELPPPTYAPESETLRHRVSQQQQLYTSPPKGDVRNKECSNKRRRHSRAKDEEDSHINSCRATEQQLQYQRNLQQHQRQLVCTLIGEVVTIENYGSIQSSDLVRDIERAVAAGCKVKINNYGTIK
ncbi:hypothetical protein FA10DRAFT_87795 [Acaromyces ingoldii]|uniref:Uncharacterized protein n=1 Tax=Acaromyces ingoldii TaxID=215250 RepID=A0A316YW31_9BASI|nr:hypothetical protein FA10DRAFT_87795 [Acaromyces ingoldii]PWN92253.1 hypothetical protein FA10DRAFT_87795 [Acaromyces ingoldii]